MEKYVIPAQHAHLDHHNLNAMLNLYDDNGLIQFDADKSAARKYMNDVILPQYLEFPTLKEKLDFFVDNDYYESEFLNMYSFDFIKSLYQRVYQAGHEFDTFMGAFKFYTSYAMKSFDGSQYLELFSDRVTVAALYLAQGDEGQATNLAEEMIYGRFQPATPTFLNAGKKQRGELVSCFLLKMEDSMDSISRGINSSLQLSKRGGGVAICITDIRESGAPIKQMRGLSSGIIPVMKLLEDSFSYANQLG